MKNMKYIIKLKQLTLFVILSFLLTNCTVIKPGNYGVLSHPLGDGIKKDKVYEDGFVWKAPWDKMYKYNIQLKGYQEEIDILTSDQLHTTISLTVVLKPNESELPFLILEIGENYYNEIVRPEVYSVTRGKIAKYNYEELSSKSRDLELEIISELKLRLAGKHIIVNKVTLDHIMYSPIVTDATDKKLATMQMLEQKKIELEIAEKEAQIQRVDAQGQRDAQQIIDQGLTQKYLQFRALEVQENLAKSDNAKFFFIPIGSDGLPVIINAND